jgi:molybdenum cofactor cytidylyltransferase
MGQSKQQLLINGKTLLALAAETALQADVGNVIVVLGDAEEDNRQLLKEMPLEIIFNPLWETGMGSSLKAGLSYALTINPETKAIIVMVCDQPLLQSTHLKLLIEKYKSTQAILVASSYANTKGVPALFDSKLFDSLLKLANAQGAKKIIQQHPCETINFPEGVVDLDTPEGYHSFLKLKKTPER